MPFQILINIVIAAMWMFLSESYTVASFISGYIVGILLLLIFNRFVPGRFYFYRVIKIGKLLLLFIRELINSTLDIVKLVYQPHSDFEPGIFALPTALESDWEITLLANLISLTPGTLTVAVAEDKNHLYIHAMDIDEIEESILSIKNTFEQTIMEVTR